MTGDKPAARPHISLIVAVARNGVIGKDGQLPWHLPEDLKRFKALTMGHHIVMGRKTWESIGRALPGRISVVVTRQPGYAAAGALVVHSLPAAIAACAGDDEIFVIGGAQIYREALPLADRIYLTRLNADYHGDTTFPELDAAWQEVACEPHRGDGAGVAFDYVLYARAGA